MYQPALPQHAQMTADGGTADGEPAGDLAGGGRMSMQHLQDFAAHRVGDRCGRLHEQKRNASVTRLKGDVGPASGRCIDGRTAVLLLRRLRRRALAESSFARLQVAQSTDPGAAVLDPD